METNVQFPDLVYNKETAICLGSSKISTTLKIRTLISQVSWIEENSTENEQTSTKLGKNFFDYF